VPTYVYKFLKTGETIEVEQSFADDALTQAVHPRTGRKMAVKKVFTPVGVTFRGDGFYKTDSRGSKKSSSSSSTNGSNGSNGSESSTASTASKSSESSSTSTSSSAPAASAAAD
jgi:predicted nucleic acid-binding Zn ribbon protein